MQYCRGRTEGKIYFFTVVTYKRKAMLTHRCIARAKVNPKPWEEENPMKLVNVTQWVIAYSESRVGRVEVRNPTFEDSMKQLTRWIKRNER